MMSCTTPCQTRHVHLRWKLCIASSSLFRFFLKEVRVCFSSSVCTKKNCSNLDFQTRIQPFSVQSLQEGVLQFQIFTTDTRMLGVDKKLTNKKTPPPLTTLGMSDAKHDFVSDLQHHHPSQRNGGLAAPLLWGNQNCLGEVWKSI